jgi:hypothetical protein
MDPVTRPPFRHSIGVPQRGYTQIEFGVLMFLHWASDSPSGRGMRQLRGVVTSRAQMRMPLRVWTEGQIPVSSMGPKAARGAIVSSWPKSPPAAKGRFIAMTSWSGSRGRVFQPGAPGGRATGARFNAALSAETRANTALRPRPGTFGQLSNSVAGTIMIG